MAHPHRSAVKSSNSAKMRAIGPKGGGAGTAFGGMSPFKRANKFGEQESFNSKSKGFESGYAHGGVVKARADRFARGGNAGLHGRKSISTKGDTPAKGAPGVEDKWGKPPKHAEEHTIAYSNKKHFRGATPGHFKKGGKVKGDVNIVIMGNHGAPRPGAPMGGAGAGMAGLGASGQPSPTPPAGAGGPMGAAPAGAAQQPVNPQLLQSIMGGGAGGMSGGMGRKEGGRVAGGFKFKKGGQVWEARPAADGGRIGQGNMPQREKHWAKYSSDNRKSIHGNTGESRELSLAMPERHEPGKLASKNREVIGEMEERAFGGRVKRASGGRLKTTSKPKGGLPGGGQATGEARLQQYRKGIF